MGRDIITMNRGDSLEFDLTIDDASSPTGKYELKTGDAVYFGLMDPHQLFENALLKKKYTIEDADAETHQLITIKLDPEDTLDLYGGRYYYAIKLHMYHVPVNEVTGEPEGDLVDKVQTIIDKTKFIILD